MDEKEEEEDLGKPTHTVFLCWMPKPLPPRNLCMDYFTQPREEEEEEEEFYLRVAWVFGGGARFVFSFRTRRLGLNFVLHFKV